MISLPDEILLKIFSFVVPNTSDSILSKQSGAYHFTWTDTKDYLALSHVSSRFRYTLFSYTPISLWLCYSFLPASHLKNSVVFLQDPIRTQSITILNIGIVYEIEGNDDQNLCADVIAKMIHILSSNLTTLSVKVDCNVLMLNPVFESVLMCSNLKELELIGFYEAPKTVSFTRGSLRELASSNPLLTLLSIDQSSICSFTHEDVLEMLPRFKNLKRVNIGRNDRQLDEHFVDTFAGGILIHYFIFVDC